MNKLSAIIVSATLVIGTPAVNAQDNGDLADALNDYLEFVEYSGGTIQPKQIPKEDLAKFFIIDARDAGQFEKGRIPGATTTSNGDK